MVQLNTTLHMRLIVTKGLNFRNKRRLQVGSLPVNIESIFQMEEFRLSGNQTFFNWGEGYNFELQLIYLSNAITHKFGLQIQCFCWNGICSWSYIWRRSTISGYQETLNLLWLSIHPSPLKNVKNRGSVLFSFSYSTRLRPIHLLIVAN